MDNKTLLIEYKNEGRKMFQSFLENMDTMIANALLQVSRVQPQQHQHVLQTPQQNPQYKNVGRNDPCPCGSGKKFKRCHGA